MLNQLARMIAPDILKSAATTHDSQTRLCFSLLLGFDSLSDATWRQACLPIRLGSFGKISAACSSANAFIASLSHSVLELPQCFPHLKDVCQTLITHCSGSLGDALTKALPPGKKFLDFLSGRNKIQQHLKRRRAALELDTMLEEASTGRDSARLQSLKGKRASAWISEIPTSPSLALNSGEYLLASSLRFGLFPFP